MKKYFLTVIALCFTMFVFATSGSTIRISSGTTVVGSGNMQVAATTTTFINDGTYTDTAGTFNVLSGIAFSGSGSTWLNNLVVNNAGSSTFNSLVSIGKTATITLGSVNAGLGNLYIRSDINTSAKLINNGTLTGTVQGLVVYATAISGSCPSYSSTLSLNISGSSMVYQWQSSADSSTWNDISGANSATYVATVAATQYYRCHLTSNNSSFDEFTPGIKLNFTSIATTSTIDSTICSSQLPFVWNGITCNTAGTFYDTLAGGNYVGCDSIITMHLHVKQSSTSTTYLTVCSNQMPYSWNGSSIPFAGSWTVPNLVNAVGCDSAATLVLTVAQPTSSVTNKSICASELPYNYLGHNMNSVGHDTLHLINAANCDSLAILNLSLSTIPGDPTVFGNHSWNVYAFNQGGGSLGNSNWSGNYAGYYTDSSLNINTTNNWNPNFSPSQASNYLGCPVTNDSHSYTAKRKGFACGRYQLDVPGHDDASELLINGVSVWSHNGCCDSHTNVWTGVLSDNDSVEYRTTEGGGQSYEELTFNLLTNSTTHFITGSHAFCNGAYTILSVPTIPNYKVLWSNNDSALSINANVAGIYTAHLYSSQNICEFNDTIAVSITPSTLSTTSQTICASKLPYSYLGHTMNAAGKDTLHLTNAGGCDSMAILSLIVNPLITPTVSLAAPSMNNICMNTPITFSASSVNAGTNPIYEWYVNGTSVGFHTSPYTRAIYTNNSIVKVKVYPQVACTATAISNSDTIAVLPKLTPYFLITRNANNVCAGTPITYSALTVTNGGTSPSYQWMVNSTMVGTNSPSYTTSTLNNLDTVKCIMTSSYGCLSKPSSTSNQFVVTINPKVTPSVSLAPPSSANICASSPVTFSASSVNAGTNPIYEWYVNGTSVGFHTSPYTRAIYTNNSIVKVKVYPQVACQVTSLSNSDTVLTHSCTIIRLKSPNNTNDNIETTAGIELYPNPALNNVAIRYQLLEDDADRVTILLMDIAGKTIQSQMIDHPEMTGVVHFDLKELQSGVYLVNVKTTNYSETKRLIVNK